MRAQIFASLDDTEVAKPKLGKENLIINELIREYLQFNNYHHTLSVLIPESGQPLNPPFDRNYIARELQVAEDYKSRSLPLLYGLVTGLAKETDERPPERPAMAPKPVKENRTLYSDEPEPFVFTK
jgi:lisH domain-containing protein FOPNL